MDYIFILYWLNKGARHFDWSSTPAYSTCFFSYTLFCITYAFDSLLTLLTTKNISLGTGLVFTSPVSTIITRHFLRDTNVDCTPLEKSVHLVFYSLLQMRETRNKIFYFTFNFTNISQFYFIDY